jgi:hypothetical protein
LAMVKAGSTSARLVWYVLFAIAVLFILALCALGRFLYKRLSDPNQPLAEQEMSAAANSDEEAFSDEYEVDEAASEMPSNSANSATSSTADWRPPLGLSPDDPDFRNKFVRGGL